VTANSDRGETPRTRIQSQFHPAHFPSTGRRGPLRFCPSVSTEVSHER
jgi:hypothetical protein